MSVIHDIKEYIRVGLKSPAEFLDEKNHMSAVDALKSSQKYESNLFFMERFGFYCLSQILRGKDPLDV